MVKNSAVIVALLASLALSACGEPAAPTQPTAAPTSDPAPKPDPAPAPTASTATPAPTASASAAPDPAKPTSSGRPAVLKADPTEISDTFGSSPASKLELGDKDIATLRLPEGALHTGTIVTFRIGKNAKTNGGVVGKVYQLQAVVPPSSNPESIDSNGPPFVLELPSANKSANLAIGVEGDKGKTKWTVVAAKRYDDGRKVLVFELPTLPSATLHVTTKSP